MTKALDAAVRAGCAVGRRVTDPPCRWPSCGCWEDRDVTIAILHAALPAEPDGELLDAILLDGPIVLRARYEAKLVYGALRAHLLGEGE